MDDYCFTYEQLGLPNPALMTSEQIRESNERRTRERESRRDEDQRKELERLRTLEDQLKKFLGMIHVTTSTSLEFHDGYDVFRGLNSLEELVKRD